MSEPSREEAAARYQEMVQAYEAAALLSDAWHREQQHRGHCWFCCKICLVGNPHHPVPVRSP